MMKQINMLLLQRINVIFLILLFIVLISCNNDRRSVYLDLENLYVETVDENTFIESISIMEIGPDTILFIKPNTPLHKFELLDNNSNSFYYFNENKFYDTSESRTIFVDISCITKKDIRSKNAYTSYDNIRDIKEIKDTLITPY